MTMTSFTLIEANFFAPPLYHYASASTAMFIFWGQLKIEGCVAFFCINFRFAHHGRRAAIQTTTKIKAKGFVHMAWESHETIGLGCPVHSLMRFSGFSQAMWTKPKAFKIEIVQRSSPASRTTTGTAREGETSPGPCLVYQLFRANLRP